MFLCRVSMLSFTYGVCLKLRYHSDTRSKCPWWTFKLSKRCTKSIKCVGRCCLRLLMTSPCLVVVLWFERCIDLFQTINIQVVACHPLDINRQVIYNWLLVVRFQKHFEHACYFHLTQLSLYSRGEFLCFQCWYMNLPVQVASLINKDLIYVNSLVSDNIRWLYRVKLYFAPILVLKCSRQRQQAKPYEYIRLWIHER